MEEQYQLPKIDEVLERMEKPVPDGIYDAVVNDVWVWQKRNGDEIFIMVLTIIDGSYAGRKFVYHYIFGDRDNAYAFRQILSAVLYRKIGKDFCIGLAELLYRRIRVHVKHNNGKRVISVEPSKRRDLVKEYRYRLVDRDQILYWLGYIPPAPDWWDGGAISYARWKGYIRPGDIEHEQ